MLSTDESPTSKQPLTWSFSTCGPVGDASILTNDSHEGGDRGAHRTRSPSGVMSHLAV